MHETGVINDQGQTVEGGHRWALDEWGDVDTLAWDYGHHNGPVCRSCEESSCIHCHPEILQAKCPGAPSSDGLPAVP